MIEKPKKERRFLKALGRVGEILIQEVLIKIGSNLIKKIGGKKTLPSILFLLASLSLFAQYPNTGNKQRLGFQTTGDGLTWRGSLSDTAAIQPTNNQNAWVILDTVNLKIYSFDFTSNTWNLVGGGSTIDTASLSNRINLKLNISDTAAMLLPYAKKSYVDTAGRFYARQDFSNVSTSTLTWTQTDTLVPAGVNVVQVYRNGQILLPSQYTIPTSTSVVIATTSFKVGENYTVIFPKGGGGSGGGSGSLTSISGGTGITVSPNPITTTGTVSADLSVLMELSDTASLSNRINTKVNISDTLSMLSPYFRDADTSSLNLTSRFALKLNSADTASLSSRINAKGTGTVTSVATGYGLSGGTITSTGTLLLDSAVVFSRIRDSIVDVAIGNDTIKILKQEYNSASTNVLTWTVTPKFPIQLKAYILVFRNGQLLINDQYNLTDTNKITIVSNSFKVGANYTVVTVSGIGSVGTGTFPNPVYPEAGIAVSTGTTWTTSIPNNSSNWNIAFNDKITNAAFTGTNTKTLTLTQYDGGTFTPTFTDLQGVTGVTAGTGLTGGTITSTGTVAVDFGVVAPLANPTFTGTVSGITKSMVGLGNVDNTSDANKPVSTATQTALNLKVNISDTASMLTPYFRDADTSLLNLTSRFNTKLNLSDTLNMLVPYLRKADTTNMLSPYFRDADTTSLNLTSRFNTKQNTLSGTGFVKANGTTISYDNSNYLRTGLADSTYLKLTGGTLTGGLTGTTGTFTSLNANNSSDAIIGLQAGDNNLSSRIQFKHFGTIRQEIVKPNSTGNLQFRSYPTGTATGGYDFYVSNGTTELLATTIGTDRSLAVTGAITEAGNNVLTNLDTASLSNRIDSKYNSSGGTISGAVTLSTTTATPSTLLGKDGSNVVGAVTTVAQTGLFGRGSVTNAVTDANGIITVAHGFSFTPIMAFANLPGSTTNIVNVKEVDGTNIVFVVRDGATNNVLNAQSVTKIEFFAIK